MSDHHQTITIVHQSCRWSLPSLLFQAFACYRSDTGMIKDADDRAREGLGVVRRTKHVPVLNGPFPPTTTWKSLLAHQTTVISVIYNYHLNVQGLFRCMPWAAESDPSQSCSPSDSCPPPLNYPIPSCCFPLTPPYSCYTHLASAATPPTAAPSHAPRIPTAHSATASSFCSFGGPSSPLLSSPLLISPFSYLFF